MNPIPFIPETAPFNAEQRAWLNGFLAGLFAAPQLSQPPVDVTPKKPLTVLFGSQTGTAEQLAKKIGRDATQKGFAARVLPMNEFASIDFKSEEKLLLVTSTWGDGEPPDNAVAFWNFLNSEQTPKLSHLGFSVLALGDSSYPDFCGAGKKLDARMEQLGARRFHPRTDCDKDYDAPAAAWMESLWSTLATTASNNSVGPELSVSSPPPPAAATDKPRYHKGNPFPARLVANRQLNEGEKETRHFEISIAESGLKYDAGDALGILPSNCPELVDQIIQKLDSDGEEEVVTSSGLKTSLRAALQHDCEIHRIPSALLKAGSARSQSVENLLRVEEKAKLDAYLAGRDVLDFLNDFGVKLSAAELVAGLKKLPPRLYSIASSPKAHPATIHLTVAVVRREFSARQRKGVCSTFLADRASEKIPVPVFLQTSPHFRPPTQSDVPMIMVGPGTGIAPFRAFLQDRAASGSTGRNWLFFGHQHAATDYFYRDELVAWQKSGVLTRLDTAFSRDQAAKIYVQDRMMENARELWAWLNEGAHFYVCGDASRMAKDVDAALRKIAEQQGGLTTEAATAFIENLRKTKRYQRDVY